MHGSEEHVLDIGTTGRPLVKDNMTVIKLFKLSNVNECVRMSQSKSRP